MPIDLRKSKEYKKEEIEEFFHEPELKPEEELEAPRNLMLEEYYNEALFQWRAPEHEISQWDKKAYFIATIILAAIIIYALLTNSPIMAITFILIGIVGYIILQKEPKILDFLLTHDGIIAGNEIYEFKNIKSFWIFYEPYGKKVLSLHMKGRLLPFMHIPIHEEDPVKIREILLDFIPEKEQEPSLVDNIERLLRL